MGISALDFYRLWEADGGVNMSNKIQIELSDLEKQGQVLGGLASQMETLTNEFNNNANKMYDSLHGFTKINLTLQSLFAIAHSKSLTQELQFGSEVAQKCVEAYRAADQQTAKDINMNQTIIEVGGDSYHEQADSTSDQVITSQTKSVTGPDGRKYNVVNNYDPNCVIKQGKDSFKKTAKGTSTSCAANSIEIIRRLNGKGYGDNFEQYMQNNGIAFEDGAIKKGGYKKAGFTELEGSKTAYGDDRRRMIYDQIMQGKAVHGNVKPKANQSHFVAFVGIAEGADPNNLKDSDFLIMDPATGTIRNLTEGKEYSLDGFESNYMYGKTDKRTLRVME